MIDLETLGIGDHAPIVQIGACWFSILDDDIGGYFGRRIRAEDWTNVDGDTVRWWMKQSQEARESVFLNGVRVPLKKAMEDLAMHIHNNSDGGGEPTLWAGPSTFDLRLIRQACDRVGVDWPFKFWLERDYSTLKREFGKPSDFVHNPIQHDALEDAKAQAVACSRILRRLRAS